MHGKTSPTPGRESGAARASLMGGHVPIMESRMLSRSMQGRDQRPPASRMPWRQRELTPDCDTSETPLFVVVIRGAGVAATECFSGYSAALSIRVFRCFGSGCGPVCVEAVVSISVSSRPLERMARGLFAAGVYAPCPDWGRLIPEGGGMEGCALALLCDSVNSVRVPGLGLGAGSRLPGGRICEVRKV